MAPKKKQQNQKAVSTSSKSKGKPAQLPISKLQISAHNENRLRRLLLNSDQTTSPAPDEADSSLSKPKKVKKLRAVYENLSCEGFTDAQIERALIALKDNATFESALDWLCLNLPGNELPLKFSSGVSSHAGEGSVGVVLTAREDWAPAVDVDSSPAESKEEIQNFSVKVKGQWDEETLDPLKSSQADWIRQYMEQQEEDESETWESNLLDDNFQDKVLKPRNDMGAIMKDYQIARLEAISAKERKDKEAQKAAGVVIRRLMQEASAIGLPADILASSFNSCPSPVSKDTSPDFMLKDIDEEDVSPSVEEFSANFFQEAPEVEQDNSTRKSSLDIKDVATLSSTAAEEKDASEEDSEEVELGNFFLEDASLSDGPPPDILDLQKKERLKELNSEKNYAKLEGIWKKGDPKKIPKAFLHQLCQREGWDAPKYSKVLETRNCPIYSVSIMRKASGWGKSRKAGGLISIQLPSQEELPSDPEDAQNRVAAHALHVLFPDLPVHLPIVEPYASSILLWKEGQLSENLEASIEDRRVGFIDSLLNASGPEKNDTEKVVGASVHKEFQMPDLKERTGPRINAKSLRLILQKKAAESSFLKKDLENKKRMRKYQEMSESRAALPITKLKGDILQLLETNNVLVVCGETGSGKTTQVPQFILDNMIEAGQGGECSIICTQPRRIAAISVAERVADERCESSPGSSDSVVGYQVRLDSARNERTKLLFCTTGILLRMVLGNKDFAGISHVIVDEVHERSLLGDFLLIVLKNLIERQSDQGTTKLKVILMSATVDSHLFSQYFGSCPVITAEGRTHPVSTYFLEDIYDIMDYRLASDSPAYLDNDTISKDKRAVGNHRGKQHLVLSGWGDESLLSEDLINPEYDPSIYTSYSEQTRRNLRKLNEEIIDYELLEDLVCYIDETFPEGAVLIFLPGVGEIQMLLDKLSANHRFSGLASEWLLPLHSSIASEDQKKVFSRPPENIRKVIIATNIAETSITIDDVVYVVESGKHKENRFDPKKKLSSMVEDWVSQANARQRRGRAGRVKPGICFSLYTRNRYEKLMRPFQLPEMLRMPLVELCLQIKLLSLGSIKPFLLKALEPPREEAIWSAISLLYKVGAIQGEEELTTLGYHLAKLPVDVLIGKMLIYGGIFGCLSPILSISAFLSYKSPFVYPKDERQNVDRAKLALLNDKIGGENASSDENGQSDHLLMMVAYRKWEKILHQSGVRAAQQFCSTHYLSSSVMFMIRDMRIQFATLLADVGLIDLPKQHQIERKKQERFDHWLSDASRVFNVYSNSSSVVKAILCAGLHPNVATCEGSVVRSALGIDGFNAEGYPVWYDGRRRVFIHPSSINHSLKIIQYPLLVFLEKVETNKVYLRDTTIVSPYSILLFGGLINVHHQTGLVSIDDWLKMAAPAQTAVLFKKLRLTLDSILRELISKPQAVSVTSNEVLNSIVHLLLEEDKGKGVK